MPSYNEAELLNQCHPVFRLALLKVLADLRAKNWQPEIRELIRTPEQQKAKMKAGYSKTMRSWHVPSTYGKLPTEDGRVQEVNGQAADIVDRRYAWGGPAANLNFQFWKDLGAAAQKFGCSWGGNWKSFRDVAHIEILYIESIPATSAWG